MTKTQLSKEYEAIMFQANQASGRRESIALYKKANSIKKRLYKVDSDRSAMQNG